MCILLTILIEIIISIPFKLHCKKIILIINLVTQIILHILSVLVFIAFSAYEIYLKLLLPFEILIVITEALLYRRMLNNNISTKRNIFLTRKGEFSFLLKFGQFRFILIFYIISYSTFGYSQYFC